jgi:hypothetical protein
VKQSRSPGLVTDEVLQLQAERHGEILRMGKQSMVNVDAMREDDESRFSVAEGSLTDPCGCELRAECYSEQLL